MLRLVLRPDKQRLKTALQAMRAMQRSPVPCALTKRDRVRASSSLSSSSSPSLLSSSSLRALGRTAPFSIESVKDLPATAATGGQKYPSNGMKKVMGICAELGKARLSALVVMTTSAGYLAAGPPLAWAPFTAVCVGTMLAACSANTFNQILERENDRQMKRTFMRPLPSGRVSVQYALSWGIASAGMSCAILGLGTNELTALLGMGNLALYALPYTLSKTRSEINTWIGAVVGAVPPLMGWAAATNCSLEALVASPDALLLASTLFLWQFPHFFALSWVHRKDYARGGFRMIPCNDPQGLRTAEVILRYSVYMAPLPILAAGLGVTGSMFALEGSLLNAYLLYLASKFHRQRTDEHARQIFRCSLWYLPVLLGGFVFHSHNWATTTVEDTEGVQEGARDDNLIAKARKHLAKVCVHEVMVQDGKAKGGGVLCPPALAANAKEEALEVLDQVKEETAASAVNVTQRGGRSS